MIHEKKNLYGERNDVVLTTYVNEHSLEFLGKVKRPAVLICPGGAYLTCSEGEGEPVAMAFNAMGYQAFVLQYSTYMQGKPGIPNPKDDMKAKEHCIFPNPMLDIKQAMKTIIENSEKWHVNEEQIVLCGFSAGAHNCGMYSVYWKEYDMPKPLATILGYPVGDYRYQKWEGMSEKEQMMYEMASVAITGKKEMNELEMDKLSIVKNITKETPPMFIWNTSEDEQVPTIQSLKIATALAENKIPFELHVFENGSHGLSLASECSSITNAQVKEDVGQWVELAHTWLKKRVKIDLLDKLPF